MTDYASPAVQAMNIIRYIGDKVLETRLPIHKLNTIAMMHDVGTPSQLLTHSLLEQLWERGLIRMNEPVRAMQQSHYSMVELTLEGWDQYEAGKRGELRGNYGFMALQFDDPELNEIVEFLKKQIKEELNYDLVHMLDVERPGIIDAIMRVQIRGSAFVIADLTHDNRGAYWEAGYAEGMGKPVVYICEKDKFEKVSTHFDTNHLTTFKWSKDNKQEFANRLIAALKLELDSQ